MSSSKPSNIVNVIFVVVTLVLGSCMDNKIGDVSITQSFSNPKTVELAKAAAKGKVLKINSLVKAGVDVNDKGYQNITPLTWAAIANNKKGFEQLLKNGADPNQAMYKDSTIVWWLSGSDRSELLKLALQYGGNPNVWFENDTPLMNAMKYEVWENYYLLLEFGADINLSDHRGYTIAFAASAWVNYDKLVELLEKGYNSDLVGLARLVSAGNLEPDHKQYPYKQKVIQMLKDRGVAYPPEPLKFKMPARHLDKKTREELERLEREGRLNPNSSGFEMLKKDREIENEK